MDPSEFEDKVFALRGYYNGQPHNFMAYQVSSGWCRQTYDKEMDSRWEFIHEYDNFYKIANCPFSQ